MFEHLDDPNPPVYSNRHHDEVNRRARTIRRHRQRTKYSLVTVSSAVVIAVVASAVASNTGAGTSHVEVGTVPGLSTPAAPPSSGPSGKRIARPLPECPVTSLRASTAGGNEYTPLKAITEVRLTNTSPTSCVLGGHPKVSFTLPDGRPYHPGPYSNATVPLGFDVSPTASSPKDEPVVLATGGAAAVFVITSYDGCDPAGQTATWHIALAGGETINLAHVNFPACTGRVLTVSYFEPTSSGGVLHVPSQTVTRTAPSTTPAAPISHPVTLLAGLNDPAVALTSFGLYVAVNATGIQTGQELELVNPATGRVEADTPLPGDIEPDQTFVVSAGTLWLELSLVGKPTGELLAFSPTTLKVRHRLVFPTGGQGLAAAEGSLWVNGAHALLKIAASTDTIVARLPFPGPRTDDLAANSTGTILAAIQFGDILDLLNPSTGAVLGRYQGTVGMGASIIGIADGQVFVSTGIGISSGFQRFDLTNHTFYNLAGGGYSPRLVVSGGRLLDNDVFYPAGGNKCAAAATDRIIAALPKAASAQAGYAVGYSDGTLYYVSRQGFTSTLNRVAFESCA